MTRTMEAKEKQSSSSYDKPPWIFKGSALYQLHFVKADAVRKIIPKEFKLVEAFGYTLGGFFLANYDNSPAGSFDELVVIGGIVWNPPTSCAWATRVLVSSQDACNHGRMAVGLPSQFAKFSKKIAPVPMIPNGKLSTFLSKIGVSNSASDKRTSIDIQVSERPDSTTSECCNINIKRFVSEIKSEKWMGPNIRMSLPSFRLRPVQPATILRVSPATESDEEETFQNIVEQSNELNLSTLVMMSKPILALEFNCLTMQVEAPIVVSDK